MIWLLLTTMALAAAAFVLFALFAPGVEGQARADGGRAEALHARLTELDREKADGRVDDEEFDLLRAEVARRLFRTVELAPRQVGQSRWGRPSLVATCILVPALAGLSYAAIGSPTVPAAPFAERTDMAAIVARAEARLRREPKDVRGWLALAPVYRRMGRMDRAASAYRRALEFGDFEPRKRSALLAELAELELTGDAAAPEAEKRLAEALVLHEDNVQARFLQAVAAERAGREAEALELWRRLLARYPDARDGWVATARSRLARLEIAAATPENERGDMIEGMVASLAARLDAKPADLEGWLRLIRSYGVLGRADAARSAYDRATREFEGRTDALARLDREARSAGIAVR